MFVTSRENKSSCLMNDDVEGGAAALVDMTDA